jgi:hypothetical protein
MKHEEDIPSTNPQNAVHCDPMCLLCVFHGIAAYGCRNRNFKADTLSTRFNAGIPCNPMGLLCVFYGLTFYSDRRDPSKAGTKTQ